ncbi:MAG TPA: hypothetical protein PKE47_06820, partial [Verrucomicrobiota bacterium]|nr:hypothetical protein [Verrucomicrobiota bacterium]
MRQLPMGVLTPADLPSDILPTHQAFPLLEILSTSPPVQRVPVQQSTIDWLGTGRAQWLGRVVELYPTFTSPATLLLAAGPAGELGAIFGTQLGILPRLAGCLEVVDVDRDGRPDLFQSGHDETQAWGADLYRNMRAISNQPPTAP